MNHPFAPNCWKSARAAVMALSILLAFITLIPFPLKSQQSPPQEVSTRSVEPTFKLQAERNMVTVRVVVRNKQGEVIDTLRREDFQVFDRGKKQTILQFSVEKPVPNAPGESAEKPSLPNRAPQGRRRQPITLPRRFVGFYFDDVSTGFSGLARSRDAADHFFKLPSIPETGWECLPRPARNHSILPMTSPRYVRHLPTLPPIPIITPTKPAAP